jgi:hypothetical protein
MNNATDNLKITTTTDDATGVVVAVRAECALFSGHSLLDCEDTVCAARPELAPFLRDNMPNSVGAHAIMWWARDLPDYY